MTLSLTELTKLTNDYFCVEDDKMDDLLRLIGVLNGTLAILPQVMERCGCADDEKLKVIANDMLVQTCSSILAASRAVLSPPLPTTTVSLSSSSDNIK